MLIINEISKGMEKLIDVIKKSYHRNTNRAKGLESIRQMMNKRNRAELLYMGFTLENNE